MAAVMEPQLGVVVAISRWRATVHYTDCPWYLSAIRRHIPLPRTMKVLLCSWCRPTTEDLIEHTPSVDWYEYGPAPLAGVKVRMVDIDPEHAADIHARTALGLGKTKAKTGTWGDR
jgi:hypothetical protein